jgi:uncharacterized protein YjiS (DUF1127 family)
MDVMEHAETAPVLDRIRGWIADWQRCARARAELEQMSRGDIQQLAHDLGLSPSELIKVGGQTGHPDLMPARLQALGLDAESVRHCDPATYRDLQRVCSRCDSAKRCAHDQARGDFETGMRDYCLNAPTIDALIADRGE